MRVYPMWVDTVDGDTLRVDSIVRYKAISADPAGGRGVVSVVTADGFRAAVGPFESERAAASFAQRYFGLVIDMGPALDATEGS